MGREEFYLTAGVVCDERCGVARASATYRADYTVQYYHEGTAIQVTEYFEEGANSWAFVASSALMVYRQDHSVERITLGPFVGDSPRVNLSLFFNDGNNRPVDVELVLFLILGAGALHMGDAFVYDLPSLRFVSPYDLP
jgi:hypothetical protein